MGELRTEAMSDGPQNIMKCVFSIAVLLGLLPVSSAALAETIGTFQAPPAAAVGEVFPAGIRRGKIDAGFSVGAGPGVRIFGSAVAHDLVVAKFHVGLILTDVVAETHWYRGNWELIGELLGGWQFSPEDRSVVGLTPVLRYNFATGRRVVPFVEVGAGVTVTDIGGPDLSGKFQFVTSGGFGLHWFLREDFAHRPAMRMRGSDRLAPSILNQINA